MMKIKSFLAAAAMLCSAGLHAAVLTATTAIHSQPDEGAAVVGYLKAGTTPTSTEASALPLTDGWMAVDIPGSFEAYVLSKEINKSLDVRPGAELHQQPNAESSVLGKMEPGDGVQITGVRGKWTRLSVNKKRVGYIRIAGVATSAPVVADNVLTAAAPVPEQPAPKVSPHNTQINSISAAQPTNPTQQVRDLGDDSTSALPRIFEGTFVSTRRPFAPRRPFDYQINDSAGVRFAYVDLSKLMVTDSVEKYLDRKVAVFGVLRKAKDSKELVIEVESLQLR